MRGGLVVGVGRGLGGHWLGCGRMGMWCILGVMGGWRGREWGRDKRVGLVLVGSVDAGSSGDHENVANYSTHDESGEKEQL